MEDGRTRGTALPAAAVAARTQNRALHAMLFLYGAVLGIKLPRVRGVAPAKTTRRLPVVLTREDVAEVLAAKSGTAWRLRFAA